jgi:DNA-binding helix-turn-helix protein
MSHRNNGEILAENIRLALAKAKLSRTDVAAKVGISRSRLSALENHNAPIRATELWDLATVLNVSPGWFFEEHIPEMTAA